MIHTAFVHHCLETLVNSKRLLVKILRERRWEERKWCIVYQRWVFAVSHNNSVSVCPVGCFISPIVDGRVTENTVFVLIHNFQILPKHRTSCLKKKHSCSHDRSVGKNADFPPKYCQYLNSLQCNVISHVIESVVSFERL